MHQLAEAIQSEATLKQAGVSSHLDKVTAAAHQHIWFTTQGFDGATETLLGSKPGDPLGDIYISCFWPRVFKEAFDDVVKAGVVLVLPKTESSPSWHDGTADLSAFDGSYVDDARFCLQPTKPENVSQDLALLANIVTEAFHKKEGCVSISRQTGRKP